MIRLGIWFVGLLLIPPLVWLYGGDVAKNGPPLAFLWTFVLVFVFADE